MIYEFILAGVSFFHPHAVTDSLGTETINGKIFVIHKVDEKETLYSIARRYGASVDGIMQSNPGMSNTLEIGQILKVPYTPKASTLTSVATSGQTHKVMTKETMYSISRQYGVSVEDIRKWNNLTDNSISVGQELIVRKPKAGQPQPQVVATKPVNTEVKPGRTHTVAPQETLYSVARQYNVSVSQIKIWNDLTSDELKVGQVVLVGPPDSTTKPTQNTVTTTPGVNKPVTTPVETAKPVEPLKQPVTEPVRTDANTTASQTKTTPPQTIRISESVKSNDEVMESGVAELIEGTEGNRKYLALHRTAPVGTILKVRNEMNNREVFVRVMGKLQDTPQNGKLIIKLSRSAYDRLGAIDPKFRVEVTYYK